ncbi:glucosamine-6-phosphate deaminase [Corynebacterium timonense]|uniref:Glucosamine-6-phosphate deaminase n=1 Tax=Corynebacterium timonense TaxID=441500 RepID=A0A1H1NAT6_9CORY|nr:glucosamine-6-phosphate deaminase [Corynebacterium timonense]SDR96062.1 glucosamine-6-phosphate deaminase [Corynebacterium timonense]
MDVLIRPTAEVARAAADIITHYIQQGATLGLATGSTPTPTYRELIRRHHEEGLSFAACRAFLLDEYYGLPRDHEQSYYATIRRELTSHIDIDDALVDSPDGTNSDYVAAAADYEERIAQAGGIDVQLLGVGTNGHVAFNEPGSSLASRTRLTSLHPQTVTDNARFFDSADDVPRHVLTQGLGTILEAGHLVLLATGSTKADAVRRLVEGPVTASCPASILQLHPRATVIVDEEAAAQLDNAEYYRFLDESAPEL